MKEFVDKLYYFSLKLDQLAENYNHLITLDPDSHEPLISGFVLVKAEEIVSNHDQGIANYDLLNKKHDIEQVREVCLWMRTLESLYILGNDSDIFFDEIRYLF